MKFFEKAKSKEKKSRHSKIGKAPKARPSTTKLSLSRRTLQIPSQSVLSSELLLEEEMTYRKLTFGDLSRQLNHHNTHVRRDAFLGLRSLLTLHNHLGLKRMNEWINNVIPIGMIEIDVSVRKNFSLLLRELVGIWKNNFELWEPFSKSFRLQLLCGLCSSVRGVRRDAVMGVEKSVELLVESNEDVEVVNKLENMITEGKDELSRKCEIVHVMCLFNEKKKLKKNCIKSSSSDTKNVVFMKNLRENEEISWNLKEKWVFGDENEMNVDSEGRKDVFHAIMNMWIECIPAEPMNSVEKSSQMKDILQLLTEFIFSEMDETDDKVIEKCEKVAFVLGTKRDEIRKHFEVYYPIYVCSSMNDDEEVTRNVNTINLLLLTILSFSENIQSSEISSVAELFSEFVNGANGIEMQEDVFIQTCRFVLNGMWVRSDHNLASIWKIILKFFSSLHPLSRTRRSLLVFFEEEVRKESESMASGLIDLVMQLPQQLYFLSSRKRVPREDVDNVCDLFLNSVRLLSYSLEFRGELVTKLQSLLIPLFYGISRRKGKRVFGPFCALHSESQEKILSTLYHLPFISEDLLGSLSACVFCKEISSEISVFLLNVVNHHILFRKTMEIDDGVSFIFTVMMFIKQLENGNEDVSEREVIIVKEIVRNLKDWNGMSTGKSNSLMVECMSKYRKELEVENENSRFYFVLMKVVFSMSECFPFDQSWLNEVSSVLFRNLCRSENSFSQQLVEDIRSKNSPLRKLDE